MESLNEHAESSDTQPDSPSRHFSIGEHLWQIGSEDSRKRAAEHFIISAKLNPHNGATFRYLGYYYSEIAIDVQRAIKCFQRAISLNPDDANSGELLCDLLDGEGKETLQIAICVEASEKSPRAFWAFGRLGYLQVHQKKYSQSVSNLQHAIRGFPASADLWEALGIAYQRLGMFSAGLKAYNRAIELDNWRIYAMIESGHIFRLLGLYKKGIEQFQQALKISPENISAKYGLASALLGLSKECINLSASRWGSSLLEEALMVTSSITTIAGHMSCIWKLCGDIQLQYARSLPWMEEVPGLDTNLRRFSNSLNSWREACSLASKGASSSYQRALHLVPWQANLYIDIAIATDLVCSFRSVPEDCKLPEKMCLGGLSLEGDNGEFWVALGCVSNQSALKQHGFIRGLQLDASLAVSWVYLGNLYRSEGELQLARQAFEHARSIDPSLALPWAAMSRDWLDVGNQDAGVAAADAYESCLKAVQIAPVAEFEIGLAYLALLSEHLSSPQVFRAVCHAVNHAPHYPEAHNLKGLVLESKKNYRSASFSYSLARLALRGAPDSIPSSWIRDISTNLARSLCKAGNAVDAILECEALKAEGLLDAHGLQIYALSLSRIGENDAALAAVKNLAANISSMEHKFRITSVIFICRMLYSISGIKAAIDSILKMPERLLQNSQLCFIVSAIHVLDQSDHLLSIILNCGMFLDSHDKIAEMHYLLALTKLVKHVSSDGFNHVSARKHLRRALHMFPDSDSLRSLLGYLILSSREWNSAHDVIKCCRISYNNEILHSASEILFAGTVECFAATNFNQNLSFQACSSLSLKGSVVPLRELQKWLRREPWNQKAMYLLIVHLFQKARHERFPSHLCIALQRLISQFFPCEPNSRMDIFSQYQKFQTLLCSSEICLRNRNYSGCIKHATESTRILLPDRYSFFAHLLLCRCYAAKNDLVNMHDEYMKCLQCGPNSYTGLMCLKFLESQFQLQKGSTPVDDKFHEYLKSQHSDATILTAEFDLIRSLSLVNSQDFSSAEKYVARSCSIDVNNFCFLLCHGAVCLELAKSSCGWQFLSRAVKSLRGARAISGTPFISALLAIAEASSGSLDKWQENFYLEWISWPPEARPAGLYFHMHLVENHAQSCKETLRGSKMILRAIHLNPSCWRYWTILEKYIFNI